MTSLLDPEFYRTGDPHPFFAELRATKPVYLEETLSERPFWVLTKHADMTRVFTETAVFSTEYGVTFDTYRGDTRDPASGKMLEFSEPGHHLKLRRAFTEPYSAPAIGKLADSIREVAVERIEHAAPLGEFDFAAEIADPVTSAVVFSLLGFPRADWPMLFDLSRRSQEETHPSQPGRKPFRTSANAANYELMKYLDRLVSDRLYDVPDAAHLQMLLGTEIDSRTLTVQEAILNCLNIMQGGNSTTRHAATGGVLALLQAPEQRARVVTPDDVTLLVEEVVRWTSPAIHFARRAMTDVEVRGRRIRAGDLVTVWVIAGNRDEEAFEHPYTFDALRTPNRHVGFIAGAHKCLGIHVARLELQILFEEIQRRLPDLAPAGPVERVASNFIAGIHRLPVAVK